MKIRQRSARESRALLLGGLLGVVAERAAMESGLWLVVSLLLCGVLGVLTVAGLQGKASSDEKPELDRDAIMNTLYPSLQRGQRGQVYPARPVVPPKNPSR